MLLLLSLLLAPAPRSFGLCLCSSPALGTVRYSTDYAAHGGRACKPAAPISAGLRASGFFFRWRGACFFYAERSKAVVERAGADGDALHYPLW